jgi:hypothetical protein
MNPANPGDHDQFRWAPEQYVPVGMRIRRVGHNLWDIDVITENGSYHYPGRPGRQVADERRSNRSRETRHADRRAVVTLDGCIRQRTDR